MMILQLLSLFGFLVFLKGKQLLEETLIYMVKQCHPPNICVTRIHLTYKIK